MIRKLRNQKEIATQTTEVGKINCQLGTHTKKTYGKSASEQLFPNRRPFSYPILTKNKRTYIDPLAPNNLLKSGAKEKHQLKTSGQTTLYFVVFLYCVYVPGGPGSPVCSKRSVPWNFGQIQDLLRLVKFSYVTLRYP